MFNQEPRAKSAYRYPVVCGLAGQSLALMDVSTCLFVWLNQALSQSTGVDVSMDSRAPATNSGYSPCSRPYTDAQWFAMDDLSGAKFLRSGDDLLYSFA